MFDDDFRPPRNRPAVDLLDELESIKGALIDRDGNDLSGDVPLLDDRVIGNLKSNANLLNIGQIFDEDAAEESDNDVSHTVPAVQFPRFTLNVAISDDLELGTQQQLPPVVAPPKKTSPPQPLAQQSSAQHSPFQQSSQQRIRPDYSREVLIQELVDEFIPQIEAELHARLRQLDDAALLHLKDPK